MFCSSGVPMWHVACYAPQKYLLNLISHASPRLVFATLVVLLVIALSNTTFAQVYGFTNLL